MPILFHQLANSELLKKAVPGATDVALGYTDLIPAAAIVPWIVYQLAGFGTLSYVVPKVVNWIMGDVRSSSPAGGANVSTPSSSRRPSAPLLVVVCVATVVYGILAQGHAGAVRRQQTAKVKHHGATTREPAGRDRRGDGRRRARRLRHRPDRRQLSGPTRSSPVDGSGAGGAPCWCSATHRTPRCACAARPMRRASCSLMGVRPLTDAALVNPTPGPRAADRGLPHPGTRRRRAPCSRRRWLPDFYRNSAPTFSIGVGGFGGSGGYRGGSRRRWRRIGVTLPPGSVAPMSSRAPPRSVAGRRRQWTPRLDRPRDGAPRPGPTARPAGATRARRCALARPACSGNRPKG